MPFHPIFDTFSDVKQWGGNYKIPVYALSGSLQFYYSRSDVDSGVIEQVFDVSGAGKFLGGSFTYTLNNLDNYRHRWSVGVDDKLFENNIGFQGIPLGVNVRSRPLSLSYSGEWRFEKAGVNYNIQYVRNMQGGNNNNNLAYAAARLGAQRSWEAFRFSIAGSYLLPKDWLATAQIRAQYTDEPLISGEQFGVGGMNSVRGLEERGGDRRQRGNCQTGSLVAGTEIQISSSRVYGCRLRKKPEYPRRSTGK